MKHRKLEESEISAIKAAISRYIGKKAEELDFKNFLLLRGKSKNVVYVSSKVLESLKNHKDIYSVGINVGELEEISGKEKFLPSLEGINLVSKYIEKNYARVNEKGESLFLYERDVFDTSIIEVVGDGKVAVFNENKELLGIGKYNGKLIKNIMDRGWYLRHGG
uniref:60S ribosome subunit biogenesis protein NIP7 n=1 Tax=Methanococcus maripaludis (strain C6 / ATCC BAA-1332) TaxID=444158 RepID=A9A8S5_METM6